MLDIHVRHHAFCIICTTCQGMNHQAGFINKGVEEHSDHTVHPAAASSLCCDEIVAHMVFLLQCYLVGSKCAGCELVCAWCTMTGGFIECMEKRQHAIRGARRGANHTRNSRWHVLRSDARRQCGPRMRICVLQPQPQSSRPGMPGRGGWAVLPASTDMSTSDRL